MEVSGRRDERDERGVLVRVDRYEWGRERAEKDDRRGAPSSDDDSQCCVCAGASVVGKNNNKQVSPGL